jgi:YD repeat-containing protein
MEKRLEDNCYGYDAANQMTSITNRKSNQTVISSYNYGYDDAGQRMWVQRANGKGDVYSHDVTDQLTNVLYEAANPDTTPSGWTKAVTYYFDAAGNRTNVTATDSGTTVYIPNELNQYTNI